MENLLAMKWRLWTVADPVKVPLPGNSTQDCASALLAIHGALHDGTMSQCYSGPLIDATIRSWKVPMGQRYASARAIAHVDANGVTGDFTDEHDPPISLYRDIIRFDRDLPFDRLIGYLGEMKITKVTEDENNCLTRLGIQRPPNGYELCTIVRRPLAEYKTALATARKRRKAARHQQQGKR